MAEIRKELINGYGWEAGDYINLNKVIGKQSVSIDLEGDKEGDHAKLHVSWSFKDRSGVYIYKDEDIEETAQNINDLAETLLNESSDERKKRQQKEKADLVQVRKDRKELEAKEKEKKKQEKAKENSAEKIKIDRNKIHEIKSWLVDRGWKLAKVYGYYKEFGDVRVWLTFGRNSVSIGSSIKASSQIDFENMDSFEAAQKIDETAENLAMIHTEGPDTNKPEHQELKLIHALNEFGWKNSHIDGGVLRTSRELLGTELPCIITMAIDLESGRTNFAWIANNEHPIQILSWVLDIADLKTKELTEKINLLYDSVQKSVRRKDAILGEEVAKQQEQKKKDDEYNAWKAKQTQTINKKDKEESWKRRLERELAQKKAPAKAINLDPAALENLVKAEIKTAETKVTPGRWFMQVVKPGQRRYFRGLKTKKKTVELLAYYMMR
jgi:hypothetical protein